MNTFLPRGVLLASLSVLSACGTDEPAATGGTAAAGAAVVTGVRGPFVHENLQLWLVLGGDEGSSARKTVPLQEALEQKIVVVHETGDVDELAIENVAPDVDVYVQSGDIVQGGKQDRTIGVDLVLAPGSGRVPLPSFCVEQGRWRTRGSAAGQTGIFGSVALGDPAGQAGAEVIDLNGFGQSVALPLVDRFACSANNVSTVDLKKAILLDRDQGKVWQEVAGTQACLNANAGQLGAVVDASSPTSLELTMNTAAVQKSTEAYVAALHGIVELHPEAVGFAFAVHGRLQSADVYGSRVLFRQLWPKLLRGAATAAVAGLKAGEPSMVVAVEQVQRLLGACEPKDARAVAAGLTMAVGEGEAGHVVESRAGGALVHRACLAR